MYIHVIFILLYINLNYGFKYTFNNINNLNRLYVDRREVYRLRRQSEIGRCMSSILDRISQSEEKIGNIGITDVRLSPDCSHVRINVHIDGDEQSIQRSLAWLSRHLKSLRFQMANKLNYRKRVPAIQFVYDKSKIDDLNIDDMIRDSEIDNINDDESLDLI